MLDFFSGPPSLAYLLIPYSQLVAAVLGIVKEMRVFSYLLFDEKYRIFYDNIYKRFSQ